VTLLFFVFSDVSLDIVEDTEGFVGVCVPGLYRHGAGRILREFEGEGIGGGPQLLHQPILINPTKKYTELKKPKITFLG